MPGKRQPMLRCFCGGLGSDDHFGGRVKALSKLDKQPLNRQQPSQLPHVDRRNPQVSFKSIPRPECGLFLFQSVF